MRLLFYHSSPLWTGRARVFAAAARGLGERGHQATFVCPAGGPVEARAAAEGCDVSPLVDGGPLPLRTWRLQRVLAERFAETVFVHTEREQLVASLALRLAGKGRVVRRVPAGERPRVARRTRLALRVAPGAFLFTRADDARPAAVPPLARASMLADLGIDVSRYDELRPASLAAVGAPAPSAGAVPAAGATAAAPRVIVCVYDPSGHARAAALLRAVALLAPRHPELHLALIGPGSRHEDLRIHAAALGIARQVSYLGERDDDLAVLRAADIGWVVAGADTGAFAALDFMAMRIPVVADRDTIAARYVADGITGALVAPGDPPATAAAVASLLAQPEQRMAMGIAGRARVAREYPERAMLDAVERAADPAHRESVGGVSIPV